MSALTERQRAFVVTFIEFPTLSHAECARRAGYPDNGENAKVVAHRLLTSERVLKALNEELDKRFRRDAVLGRSVLLEIAQDKEHPQRLKAAEALLNRGGFGVLHEQRIRVEHSDMSFMRCCTVVCHGGEGMLRSYGWQGHAGRGCGAWRHHGHLGAASVLMS